MADITKCKGEGCKLKKQCFRYTAKDGFMQSYFMQSPIKYGKCEHQIKTKKDEL